MKTATVANFRDQLSEYLRLVEAGETVTILRRDRPVAQLSPVSPARQDEDAFLDKLEREGVVRRGSGDFTGFRFPDPNAPPSGAVEALLKEREEGW